MKVQQSGFTLIELVIVIVILGLLAATALPRFVDLSGQAEDAAVAGVGGGMGSAMAVNYAACVAGSADCVTVDNCNDTAAIMSGGLPAGYTVAALAIGAARGDTVTCVVEQTSSTKTANFTGINTL